MDNKILPKANEKVGGYLVGKEGGKTVLHEDGNKGGMFVGRSHAEKGGIQATNTDTGQPLLVESKEAQIAPAATKSGDTHNFNGKQMTNKQILSEINQSGGGVAIAKKGTILDERKGQPIQLPASSIIITRPAVADKTKRMFDGKMLTNLEILSIINQNAGGVALTEDSTHMQACGREYEYGGKITKDYEIASSCGCQHNHMATGGKMQPKAGDIIYLYEFFDTNKDSIFPRDRKSYEYNKFNGDKFVHGALNLLEQALYSESLLDKIKDKAIAANKKAEGMGRSDYRMEVFVKPRDNKKMPWNPEFKVELDDDQHMATGGKLQPKEMKIISVYEFFYVGKESIFPRASVKYKFNDFNDEGDMIEGRLIEQSVYNEGNLEKAEATAIVANKKAKMLDRPDYHMDVFVHPRGSKKEHWSPEYKIPMGDGGEKDYTAVFQKGNERRVMPVRAISKSKAITEAMMSRNHFGIGADYDLIDIKEDTGRVPFSGIKESYNSIFPKMWDRFSTQERANLLEGWNIQSDNDFQPTVYSELPEDVKNKLFYAFAKAGSNVTEQDKEEITRAFENRDKSYAEGGATERGGQSLSMDSYFNIDKNNFIVTTRDGKTVYTGTDLTDAKLWCKQQMGYKLYANDIPDNVKAFMPPMQQKVIIGSVEHWDVIRRLYNIIRDMPVLYGTESTTSKDKLLLLHYFYGSSNWYIIEKAGEEDGQDAEAFGYAILNGDDENAEWGYIDISELRNSGKVELDFYFEPMRFSELNISANGYEGSALDDLDNDTEEPEVTFIPETRTSANNEYNEPFVYGAGGYGVPKVYGSEVIMGLKAKGYTIVTQNPEIIKITKDASGEKDVMYVNDNGGEFNLGDEHSAEHIGDVPYDGTIGIRRPYSIVKDINEMYDAFYNSGKVVDEPAEPVAEIPPTASAPQSNNKIQDTMAITNPDPITDNNITANKLVINANEKITSKKQYEINIAVTALVKEKGPDRSKYSTDEIALLKLWSGSGSLAKQGATGTGLLDQFFTPADIVSKMWGLAIKYGFSFNGANILEPSVGVGRFFANIPKDVPVNVVGYDIDEVAVTICKVLYPNYDIKLGSFESMFFTGRRHIGLAGLRQPFDLVITNPPYRPYVSEYSPLGEKEATGADTFEMYFIMRGVDVLRKGGLLIMIIPNTFMSNDSKYNEFKEKLAKKADLLDAYRLPNGVFPNTEVCTDIIVLRKK